MAVPSFVDQVLLEAVAGNGGAGCASVHREKFKPLGGPDGGSGGRGGDVVLVVDDRTTTLIELHRRPHRKAVSGGQGKGGDRDGADGDDIEVSVPPGTVVRIDGEQVADLLTPGTRHVLAHGGHGGLGNAALASARRKAPGFALLGEPGDLVLASLELKTVADIGLVGYPNAGKSSLVGALSAARPKVADYAFTTLIPSLGVVTSGETVFTVADVPGLIPGAATGRGLGHEFLRHIERCAALVHVLDCATPESGRDPISDLDVIQAELRAYSDATGTDLADRPQLIALNKIDSPEARELAELVGEELTARGLRVFPISAASGEGLRLLTYAMADLVEMRRAILPGTAGPVPPTVLRPRRRAPEDTFVVTAEGSGADVSYRVRGDRPERWVRQTDFTNDEAVGYLAERLARIGVEDALRKAGAQAGATVIIGADSDRGGPVVFDWAPSVPVDLGTVAGAVQRGPRGSDPRLLRGAADEYDDEDEIDDSPIPELGPAAGEDPVDEAPHGRP